MTSGFPKGYLKRLKKLPSHAQKRAIKALDVLERDERYPSLHVIEVKANERAWSIRVSGDYRMVGYR